MRLPSGDDAWAYRSFRRVEPDQATLLPADRMRVHHIDVDRGAAELVEFPCAAILIDARGRGPAASDHQIAYLQAFFARRPDLNRTLAAVFVTHTHLAHNSNLERVAETFTVARDIHNGLTTGSGRRAAGWMLVYS